MIRDLVLPDGRSLRTDVDGDLAGPIVVFHPGTPGGITPPAELLAATAAAGAALLSIARPGYPGSTRQPGRTVRAVAVDTTSVLDALGVRPDRVYLLGWSGGGPHALACAALLPSCRAVATIAGAGPDDLDLDLDAGMAAENVEEFAAARRGEDVLRPWLERAAASMVGAGPAALVAAMGDLLPPVDRAALTVDRAAWFAASSDEALVAGVDGWLDDDLAFVKPWGFAPADVAVPAAVWQGEADSMVPIAHGRWLAAELPDARAHLLAGEGHLSLAFDHAEEIVTELLALA